MTRPRDVTDDLSRLDPLTVTPGRLPESAGPRPACTRRGVVLPDEVWARLDASGLPRSEAVLRAVLAGLEVSPRSPG